MVGGTACSPGGVLPAYPGGGFSLHTLVVGGYSLHTLGGTMVGIHLPTMVSYPPSRVYLRPSMSPGPMSALSAVQGDNALGSEREKPMGEGPLPVLKS